MPERTPSRTAAGVAWLRAAHQLVDAEPRILDDPVAPLLLGPAGRRAIDERRAELFTPAALALRSNVLLRSAFAEDRLELAVSRGVRQVIILGAGLDTFGYRQPSWAGPLRIFEVDQVASQRVKRERLAAAGIAPPDNLLYAPIDFETEELVDALVRAGVDVGAPAFVSWLGVSMYLSRPAVAGVFRAIAAFPTPSEMVFTFAQPRPPGPSVADRAAALGEPWLSYFTPAELRRAVLDAGFTDLEFLDGDVAAVYFAGRTDGLAPPRRVSVAVALR